jgi:hypothetical protein
MPCLHSLLFSKIQNSIMEFVFLMALILIFFRIASATAALAEDIGKSYWAWFILGLFLPLVAMGILFCLPRKRKKHAPELRAVENDEIFDHLFIVKHPKQRA